MGVRIWVSDPGTRLQEFESGRSKLDVRSLWSSSRAHTWESEFGCPILSPIPGVRMWESESGPPFLGVCFWVSDLESDSMSLNLGV